MNNRSQRWSYVYLCAAPFVFVGTAARALHVPGVQEALGIAICGSMLFAAWKLGARAIAAAPDHAKRIGLAGGLLVSTFALAAPFFVGLGPPWEAAQVENRTRYAVLLVMSIMVFGGLVALRTALEDAGERFFSTLGLIAAALAGPLYVLWNIFALADFVAAARTGHGDPAVTSLANTLDIMLFVAGSLTYVSTAAFAAALGRAGWLGRRAASIYIVVNLIALACLVARGLAFPDPVALSTPWYTQPGFVAGIPAIPWIMPHLLGVVVLRRANQSG